MIDFSSIEKPVVIELSKLKKWDDNPREISQQNLEDVKYKIQKYSKFLQGHPLWITPDKTEQGKYIVFGGNQRLEAAKQLGWDKIPAIIFENITEKEMKEAALIDNKTDGVWKFPVLKEKFKDIDFIKLGFPDLNFTPKQIEFKPSSFVEEPTQEDTIKQEQCGYPIQNEYSNEIPINQQEYQQDIIKRTIKIKCPHCQEEFDYEID